MKSGLPSQVRLTIVKEAEFCAMLALCDLTNIEARLGVDRETKSNGDNIDAVHCGDSVLPCGKC